MVVINSNFRYILFIFMSVLPNLNKNAFDNNKKHFYMLLIKK